ncbi:Peptidase M48 [uncultured Caudovirales phage]|uniref:Peptidase M48 n=1 Tax=uncultured Caudovirales phage TaxID=2100421 RepID=A0A6J5KHB9_9CAUD|nr:Peptidase M48 [uncultured Caudovirales phage]
MSKTLKVCAGIMVLIYVVILGTLIKHRYMMPKKPLTNQEIQQVFNNLTKYLGITFLPTLVIARNDNTINAVTDEDSLTITIYGGMINIIYTKDEMAAVLAHELGHAMMQDQYLSKAANNSDAMQTIVEGNADKYSTYLVLRAGYDVCQMQNIWRRFRRIYGDYETNEDHPNHSYRTWQLEFPECSRSYY